MKVTLDHNCMLNLINSTEAGAALRRVLAAGEHQFFVAEVGASEMRQRGVRPNRYDLFEKLLSDAGIEHLPRLSPIDIWDVGFVDHCLWADDQMEAVRRQIETILFPDGVLGESADPDSPDGRKWINRTCDVLTMWCHIHHGNHVFLTSDGNFAKETKLPRLLALGAGGSASRASSNENRPEGRLLMLPTNGGQSDQAVVDSSKASGAT